jgi:RNA polymerase sigma factor (sigma-70 family)
MYVMDDDQIIASFRNKDDRKIDKFYKEARTKVIQAIRFYASLSKDEADELFQDAFIELHARIMSGRLKNADNLVGYLINASKYMWSDEYKRRRKIMGDHINTNELTTNHEKEMEELLVSEEKETLVRMAVAELKEPCSKILELFYWAKMKYDAMLAEMREYKNVDTLKAQKYRCIKHLERRLLPLMNRVY